MTLIVCCRYGRHDIHTFNIPVVGRNVDCRGVFFRPLGRNLAKLVVTYKTCLFLTVYSHGYVLFCAVTLSMCLGTSYEITWSRPCTAKTTLSPVSPEKAKQPKALYCADMCVTKHNTDVFYSIVSTISPAYIAYVCVIWCQKQMFICDSLLLHRKIMWTLIVTDKPMSSSLQLNAGQFLLSW